jgi:hypothetical protein
MVEESLVVPEQAPVAEDLRPLPLEERRARLRKALRGSGKALRFSEHLEGEGPEIYRHACGLGLEIRFLFAQNITRHTRAMAAEGISEVDISFWVDAVAAGYGLRFDEEKGTS